MEVFDSEKEFTVNNPFYLSKVTVLQDIHYDINHGLFFITHRTDVEISKIYRINPDKITNASVKEPLIPDEVSFQILQFQKLNLFVLLLPV